MVQTVYGKKLKILTTFDTTDDKVYSCLEWKKILNYDSLCYNKSELSLKLYNNDEYNKVYVCDILLCITIKSIVNPCKATGGCYKFNIKINETNKSIETTLNNTLSYPNNV
jgi:hypothetical protein